MFSGKLLLTISLVFGFMFPCMLPSYADTTRVVEIDAIPVTITVGRHVDGRAPMTAECVVPYSQETVWQVLTDYNHLDEFVPFITQSRITKGSHGEKLLTQSGRAGLWFFKKAFSVVFSVEEVPMREIKFTALEGDFAYFDGFWQIESKPEGTLIRHRVDIEPAFYVPRWVRNIVERYLMMTSLKSVIERFRIISETLP